MGTVRGDQRDPCSLAPALEGISLVMHAAAYLGPDRTLAEAVNVAGTRSLAQAALAAGALRLVHISLPCLPFRLAASRWVALRHVRATI